jgi:hypothetical protein
MSASCQPGVGAVGFGAAAGIGRLTGAMYTGPQPFLYRLGIFIGR